MDILVIQDKKARIGKLNLSRFARALKKHRGYTPLSQFVAEHKIPVTKQAISYIEKGQRNPSPAVMLRLLEIMNLPPTDFLE